MKLPPFLIKGYGRTCFRCLAYAEVVIGEKFQKRYAGEGSSAVCGIFLPSAKNQPDYSLKVFRGHSSIGPSLFSGRLEQGVASAFLYAQTFHKIPPCAWQLYPMKSEDRPSPVYRRERKSLADVLWFYRMNAGASNKNEDFKNAILNPFFSWDATRGCFGVGIDASEDKEFEGVMLIQARNRK